MQHINWTALVAVILVLGVMISMILFAVSELNHGTAGHISEAESTLFATIFGAAIGAVAGYLGANRDGGDHDK